MKSAKTRPIRLVDLFLPLRKPADELENAVYKEQQQQIVATGLTMAAVMSASGLVVIAVFWSTVPTWMAFAWYTPIFLYALYMAHIWRSYKNSSPPKEVSGHFLKMGDIGGIITGMSWGSSVFIFPVAYDQNLFFLAMVLVGMGAGITSLLTTVPRITTRYIICSILPLALISALTATSVSIALAALTITYAIALIAGSLRSYSNLRRLLIASGAARSAKQGLVDAIEATREAFVIYDENDKQLVANASFRGLFPSGDLEKGLKRDSLRQIHGRWLMQSSRETAQGGRVVVHTDVTTLKHRERELISAQREAEDADQAKTRFISTMSHELRTPLNIILGFSKLMTEDSNIELSDKDVQEYAKSIHTSGDNLLTLINDIIDYSKLGLDKYMLDSTVVDLKAMLVKAISLSITHVGNASTSDVHISIAPGMGDLMVDQVAFRRILVNLIGNALKFRTEDPRVIVRAGLHRNGQPFIAVRDFGCGMTEDQLEHAFEAFYQGDPELNRRQGGTGLGLTLSRHLARLHEGDIILKSNAGAGTTAMLVLPVESHVPLIRDENIQIPDQKVA